MVDNSQAIQRQMVDELDAAILKFFGSEERARSLAPLFTVETMDHTDHDTFSTITTIRPKTSEELLKIGIIE